MYSIMEPNHPQWPEFINRLEQLVNDDGCEGDHSRTIRAMRDMGSCDKEIAGRLAWLKNLGGGCDCEILMNVGAK